MNSIKSMVEKNIDAQLREIQEVLDDLREQEGNLDDFIEKKISYSIKNKLATHKIKKTIDEYIKENKDFIESLHTNMINKYRKFFSDKKRVLENTRDKLELLR